MARLTEGILGPFSGKVGTVVGYRWRGVPCVRGYVRQINYPNTAQQQVEREWFVAMVRFAAKARQALLLGFGEQARGAQMTEGNWFVRRNKQNFSTVDGAVKVDYASLTLAAGAAAPVSFHAPQFGEDGVLSVDFEKNTMFARASPEDKVYLYAYCPDTEAGMLMAPVARRTKRVRVSLPDAWRGREVHVWGFVVDREGRASASAYVGCRSQVSTTEATVEIGEPTALEHSAEHTSENPSAVAVDAPEPHLRT